MARKTKRKSVPRETRKFQLRKGEQYPVDTHVAEILNYARSQRREVTVIREAVSLYHDLEQGNLEALFEKFPQYKAIKDGSGGAGGIDLKELAKEVASQIILQGGTGGYTMQSLKPTTGKQIAAPNSIAMPNFDDDDLPALSVKKDSKTNASLNFMQSIGSIQ